MAANRRADCTRSACFENKKDFTLDSLIAAAFDSYLTWFEKPLPALIKAWDETPSSNPLKAETGGADRAAARVGSPLGRRFGPHVARGLLGRGYPAPGRREAQRGGSRPTKTTSATEHRRSNCLQSLAAASDKLTADFGSWKTPWGDINRFQRLTGDIVQPFNDAGPSIPVGFTSSQWGSLASFGARAYPGTKKWYGTSGNSFVAVVEFGDRVHAQAVTAGGESGNPASPHFNDEAKRYSTGDLREVYFYRTQLKGHTERQYHPGS